MSHATTRRTAILIALILLCFGALYLHGLGDWLINDDEGSFLYQVWQMTEGKAPYRDFLSSRDPLFLYSGLIWMKLWGANVVSMRVLSVGLTLITAIFVFLLAQQTVPVEGALLSLIAFLLHPDIVHYGRTFQPEPFYLLGVTAGLYTFTVGKLRAKPTWSAIAGLIFAIAALYKLIAVLALGGCGLYLVVNGWQKKIPLRRLAVDIAWLVIPFAILWGTVMGLCLTLVPGFYEGVIALNLAQGSDLSLIQVWSKGLFFLVSYLLLFTPLILLSLPAAWQGWAGKLTLPLAWQLPTALAFILLSRALFPRLLYYLIPTLVTLFIIALNPLRHLEHHKYFYFLVIYAVLIPWASKDAERLSLREDATPIIAQYIRARTEPQDHVLADYQELNFHARRPATYLGAEISQVIVEGAVITGQKLIAEIEADQVQLVVIDISPETGHQLTLLSDALLFQAYLENHFELLDVLPRAAQRIAIYRRLPTE